MFAKLLEGGGQDKSVASNKISGGNLLLGKYFYKILYHQTNINKTKIKELRTSYTQS